MYENTMIIANGKCITADISSLVYNRSTQKYDVTFNKGLTYHYSYNSILKLNNPIIKNPNLFLIRNEYGEIKDISKIQEYSHNGIKYWRIIKFNGKVLEKRKDEFKISESIESRRETRDLFSYLKEIAEVISLRTEDDKAILVGKYNRTEFINEDTILYNYIYPQFPLKKIRSNSSPIFPFGCNKSQYKAVKTALNERVSVIQGPPGTGKTQTILNIIANLLLEGKSIQVVAENNSAVKNIYNKLRDLNLDFLVASLGSEDNKKFFISGQSGNYPDLSSLHYGVPSKEEFNELIQSRYVKIEDYYNKKEEFSKINEKLRQLRHEKQIFIKDYDEFVESELEFKFNKSINSEKILQLIFELNYKFENQIKFSWFFKFKCLFYYHFTCAPVYEDNFSSLIAYLYKCYYDVEEHKMEKELREVEDIIKDYEKKEIEKKFIAISRKWLQENIFKKFCYKKDRLIYRDTDLKNSPFKFLEDYPIILSTTYSSITSLGDSAIYDYVIMDEASQVNVVTGALALARARNIVIVGDDKQLPNVVTDEDRIKTEKIFNKYQIDNNYNYANNSFLSSVERVFKNAPVTLLREHYRCHPAIIGFCNKQFYNDELLIMRKDNGDKNAISLYRTVEGNHERDHFNQRQIDVIKNEILPNLTCANKDIGIIAPYNNQVKALKENLSDEIEISTVHKFQGREKSVIILSTVDNEITEFTNNPNLLNVAVSRAKDKFILVVSGNSQNSNNISDLVSYIEFNSNCIVNSQIRSVFDYLYSQYYIVRKEFIRKHRLISEYDSENLFYDLLIRVINENGYSNFGVAVHFPLNQIIKDYSKLEQNEVLYAQNPLAHVDFLIYKKINKQPLLAIEVDGYKYHNKKTKQYNNDLLKDHIFECYGLNLQRFSTTGSGEKERLKLLLEQISGNG